MLGSLRLLTTSSLPPLFFFFFPFLSFFFLLGSRYCYQTLNAQLSDTMGLDKATHIANLKAAFPSTTVLNESSSETVVKVDHSIRLSVAVEYELTLFIKLPSSFPKVPPTVTLPYCCSTVPITPPNMSPTEAEAFKWDANSSTLTEAVRNAFQNAADRWGPVQPPTMTSITLQLSGETDRLLHDLNTNHNCLDAYCYQLPLVKQMRESGKQSVAEVEKIANENVKLRPAVEALQREVESLQAQLQQHVSAFDAANKNKAFASVATPTALHNTLVEDVRKLNVETEQIRKELLACSGSEKKKFNELLERYNERCKLKNLVDLKRQAYKASMSV